MTGVAGGRGNHVMRSNDLSGFQETHQQSISLIIDFDNPLTQRILIFGIGRDTKSNIFYLKLII